LTPAQHLLVAAALRRAAALELALGDDVAAGRRLLVLVEEARQGRAAAAQ
jgi:hypothetical protein